MYGVPSSSPQSYTATMLGWLRAAAACASARKRRRNVSSSASAACSSFTATRRRSRTSSARYTWADAPVPRGAMSRYRPLSTRPIWSVRRDMTTQGGYLVALRPRRTPSVRGGWGFPDRSGQTGQAMTASLPAALPWTLRAAAGLVSVEALIEGIAVTGRTALTPGLRVVLVLCLAIKWLFAWRILRLSHGAALGLLLLEGTTLVAALGAVETDMLVRAALGGT